jgi:hypothetical protein
MDKSQHYILPNFSHWVWQGITAGRMINALIGMKTTGTG